MKKSHILYLCIAFMFVILPNIGNSQATAFSFDIQVTPHYLNVSSYDTLYTLNVLLPTNQVDSIAKVFIQVGTADTLSDVFSGEFDIVTQSASVSGSQIYSSSSYLKLRLGRFLTTGYAYRVRIQKQSGHYTQWVSAYYQ